MKIIAIGDSTVYGLGVTRPYTWCAKAAAITGHEFVNKGVNGDTTSGMLARLDRDCLAENPDCLILMGGYNDIFFSENPGIPQCNMAAMYDLCLSKHLPAMICINAPIYPPMVSPNYHALVNFDKIMPMLADYREWLKRFAKAFGAPTIDFYSLFAETPEDQRATQFIDGLHHTKEMHEEMAHLVAERINQVFSK